MIDLNFSSFDIPDTKIVTSSNIFSSGENIDEDGLYSERIFGPTKNYKCKCGHYVGKYYEDQVCPKCGVLCASNLIRYEQFGKIKLPDNVYVILPTTIPLLEKFFSTAIINEFLNPKCFQELVQHPYYYSIPHRKLKKLEQIDHNEDYIDLPIIGINELRELTHECARLNIINIRPDILANMFLNEIPVLPAELRPLSKVDGKFNIHELTKLYKDIITLSTGGFILNAIASQSTYASFVSIRYQNILNEIYQHIVEKFFAEKEGLLRYDFMGKTVEFSGRLVIVPDPTLKPYEIGMSKLAIDKLTLLHKMHFILENYGIEDKYNLKDILGDGTYKNSDLQLDDQDFVDMIMKHKHEFNFIIERNPTLWRYSMCGMKLGRIYL